MRGLSSKIGFATAISAVLFLVFLDKSGQVSCQNSEDFKDSVDSNLFASLSQEEAVEVSESLRSGRQVQKNHTKAVGSSKGHNVHVHRGFGEKISASGKTANVTKEYYVLKNASLVSTEVPFVVKGKKIIDISDKKYTFPPYFSTTVKPTTTKSTTTTRAPRNLSSRASKPTTRLTPPNNGQYVPVSRRPATTPRPTTTTSRTTEHPAETTTPTTQRSTTEFKYVSLKKTSRPVKVITKTFRPVLRTEAPTEAEGSTVPDIAAPTGQTPSSAEIPSTTQKGIHYIITIIGRPSANQKNLTATEDSVEVQDEYTEFESSTDGPTEVAVNETESPASVSLPTTTPKITPTEVPFEDVVAKTRPFHPDDNLFTVEIPPSAITDHFRPGIFQSVENFRQARPQNRPEIIRTIQPNYFQNIGSRNPYKSSVDIQPQYIPLQTVVNYQPIPSNTATTTQFRGRDISNQYISQDSIFRARDPPRVTNAVFTNNNDIDKLRSVEYRGREADKVRNPEFRTEDSDRARNIIFRGRELNQNNNSPFLTSKTVLYYTQVSSNTEDSGRVKPTGSPLNSIAIPEFRGIRTQRQPERGINAPVAARSFYLGTTQERLPVSGSGFGGTAPLLANFIPNSN